MGHQEREARSFIRSLTRRAGAQALLLAMLGCSGTAPLLDGAEVGVSDDPLRVTNGMTANGLTTNGLTTNGLTTNGLTTNGLATQQFADWFNSNPPDYSNMVMQYLVVCALAAGQSLTWINPLTSVQYTWPGRLGLTPGWTGGAPTTVAEQQLISACLAAHVNKYGIQIPISVLGRNSLGSSIPIGSDELTTFDRREACFFGNLFNGDGIFAASDGNLNTHQSTARGCGLSSQSSGSSIECPPIVHVGQCGHICVLESKGGTFYETCTYNGKEYRPLTTRIRSQDIYRCGDGTCQFTEKCGDGDSYNSCRTDCGRCT